jgi:hypothetical protein
MMEPTACNALSSDGHRPPIRFESHVHFSVKPASAGRVPRNRRCCCSCRIHQWRHQPNHRPCNCRCQWPCPVHASVNSVKYVNGMAFSPARPCWCFSVRSPRGGTKNFNRSTLLSVFFASREDKCAAGRIGGLGHQKLRYSTKYTREEVAHFIDATRCNGVLWSIDSLVERRALFQRECVVEHHQQ